MKISKFIVVSVIVAVAMVFIAPLVSLEPTALRSAKAALALFAALTTLVVANLVQCRRILDEPLTDSINVLRPPEDVLDLVCSRLC
jgi:membrane protein YdbS with pleckstrin-like domain